MKTVLVVIAAALLIRYFGPAREFADWMIHRAHLAEGLAPVGVCIVLGAIVTLFQSR